MIAVPRHQLLILVPGMAVEDGAERLLNIVEGINAVQLAGRHEGGEHGLTFGAHIVACEERVLSCECNWSDDVLNRVGIQSRRSSSNDLPPKTPAADDLENWGVAN